MPYSHKTNATFFNTTYRKISPLRRAGEGGEEKLRRLSPGCHMCHKIVTEMSQDCPAVSRDVADVSPDVTEMSRPSHIFVTRCHKLSQQLSYQSRRVTECQYICRHVNKLTYPRCAEGWQASGRPSACALLQQVSALRRPKCDPCAIFERLGSTQIQAASRRPHAEGACACAAVSVAVRGPRGR